MLFSTPIFLFGFLPLVLLGAFVATRIDRLVGERHHLANAWLLLASLVFYFWGEQWLVLWMVASIATNWLLGLAIGRARARGGRGLGFVALGVLVNLGLLGWFKYANFFVGGFVDGWVEIALPIGISFYTFQALSYLLDVSRGNAEVQNNPLDFGLYIALFPQLIAGPIVRYRDIAEQLRERRASIELFASGVHRFVLGLTKKVIVADWAAQAADGLFGVPTSELSPTAAWLGLAAYTIQIYFDFSGYSDMAIGLGRMFGFRLLENFRWPYISRSITEFWRRWHISLSSWFRDYLYIPLGGNRRGVLNTYRNLVLVFLLCGLWHGAAWTFVAWGAYHGLFLVLERRGLGGILDRAPVALRHAYVVVVVMFGWLLFRADSLAHAAGYARALVGLTNSPEAVVHLGRHFGNCQAAALVLGVIGSTPWLPWLGERLRSYPRPWVEVASLVGLAGLWFVAMATVAADTYNPFIYFRF
ncbi:MAG: MBOAT family protein [Planctomycetota bacterium]